MHCVGSKTDLSLWMVNASDASKRTVLCTFSRHSLLVLPCKYELSTNITEIKPCFRSAANGGFKNLVNTLIASEYQFGMPKYL